MSGRRDPKADGTTTGPVANKLQFEHARRVAARIRTGMIHLTVPRDPFAPFGGYKQSGNGREWGREGFKEFLEIKAVMGCYE